MRLLPVSGHGVKAYLKAAWKLRQLVRKERPDVIHAHYSVCGHAAVLATLGMIHRPKIMVSILGSFPKQNRKWRLVRFCIQHVWDKTLVKSKRTANQLGLDLPVIPNGVNLEVFRLMNYAEARKVVGFDTNDQSPITNHKYIIWCSNPERPEKDWPLAEAAVAAANQHLSSAKSQISLVPVFNKTPDEVCTYMNAADCLLLTSVSEGSPNVIKEAMACNCPIVTTDVGDVTERLAGLEGCHVVDSREPNELAEAIRKALDFGKRTEGRTRLIEDGLAVEQVAMKIKNLYEQLI